MVYSRAVKVIIGENTTLSYGTTILTTGYDLSNYNNYINKIHKSNKIEIGKNVWICANVTILHGVTINDDVVIATGSVMSDNLLEKRAIYGGIPARKIKNF
jgi:maltose O-acetyltransferase